MKSPRRRPRPSTPDAARLREGDGPRMTVNYRESHGMHASCGILFNHEILAARPS